MARKLLTKSTRYQLVFSLVILIVATPALYFMTHYLYLQETDETLALHKKEFLADHPSFTAADILPWNTYNRNVKILPNSGLKTDTLFTKIYFDAAENESEPYRELRSPIIIDGQTYTYQERNNLIEQEDMVLGIAALFSIVILLMLAGLLIISRISSARLWKPFYQTLGEMEGFELDKNQVPESGDTGIEEFDRLNRSVRRLIEKNQAVYQTQKEFVEYAAHELQTPLALFQGKIDTLLQTSLNLMQSEVVTALNGDIARLNRLNKNLLLLSKIEHGKYPEQASVSVIEILTRNMAFFKEQAKGKQLVFAIDFNRELTVTANPALLETLLNNLFLNAIRHNIMQGNIEITASETSIVFRNTGEAIALSADRMFNRFAKKDSSGTGNGLGLSIVKRITALHDWKIEYEFDANWHTFRVVFF